MLDQIIAQQTRIALRRFIIDHGWPESARRLGMSQLYLKLVVRGRKATTADLFTKLGLVVGVDFANKQDHTARAIIDKHSGQVIQIIVDDLN